MSRLPKKGLVKRALDAKKKYERNRAHYQTQKQEKAIRLAIQRLATTLDISSMEIEVLRHKVEHGVVSVFLEIDNLEFWVSEPNAYYIVRDEEGDIVSTRKVDTLAELGYLIDDDIIADARPDDQG